MQLVQSILSALFVIGVLVFVHELGHFIVARACGVKVHVFALGFGPRIWGMRRGETDYQVNAVPLGGYVKMHGEDPDEAVTEDAARSFQAQSPWRRIAIVFAGPASNILFAWLIFFLFFIVGFPAPSARVGDVKPGYPAAVAGVAKGDLIIAIGGKPVRSWDDVSKTIKSSEGKTLSVEIERSGVWSSLALAPRMDDGRNLFGEAVRVPVVGIVASDETVQIVLPVHEALVRSAIQSYELVEVTVQTIVKLIRRVIPMSTLGGPIMITQMAGETARTGGASSLFALMALLSVNLGVLNLLPIPILDGNLILLSLYEGVTRRTVSPQVRAALTYVGLALIGMLTVTVFYNDIMRIVMSR